MKLIKFTPKGLAELQKKLEQFKNDRPAAVTELSRAREMGDLSENGLYTAAKSQLRSIDSQIRRIENQIKLAEVVDTKKITIEQDGQRIEYEIVGDFEADPTNRKISANSPIGNALKSAKQGETIQIQTPRGIKKFKVL